MTIGDILMPRQFEPRIYRKKDVVLLGSWFQSVEMGAPGNQEAIPTTGK